MSGGAFGYMGRVESVQEVLEKVDWLPEIAGRLRELGHKGAAKETQALYDRLVARPPGFEALVKVWGAVDYEGSNDMGLQDVAEAVAEWAVREQTVASVLHDALVAEVANSLRCEPPRAELLLGGERAAWALAVPLAVVKAVERPLPTGPSTRAVLRLLIQATTNTLRADPHQPYRRLLERVPWACSREMALRAELRYQDIADRADGDAKADEVAYGDAYRRVARLAKLLHEDYSGDLHQESFRDAAQAFTRVVCRKYDGPILTALLVKLRELQADSAHLA